MKSLIDWKKYRYKEIDWERHGHKEIYQDYISGITLQHYETHIFRFRIVNIKKLLVNLIYLKFKIFQKILNVAYL